MRSSREAQRQSALLMDVMLREPRLVQAVIAGDVQGVGMLTEGLASEVRQMLVALLQPDTVGAPRLFLPEIPLGMEPFEVEGA